MTPGLPAPAGPRGPHRSRQAPTCQDGPCAELRPDSEHVLPRATQAETYHLDPSCPTRRPEAERRQLAPPGERELWGHKLQAK